MALTERAKLPAPEAVFGFFVAVILGLAFLLGSRPTFGPAQTRRLAPKNWNRTPVEGAPGWWKFDVRGEFQTDYYINFLNFKGADVLPAPLVPGSDFPALLITSATGEYRLDVATEEEAHALAVWICQQHEAERIRVNKLEGLSEAIGALQVREVEKNE